MMQNRITVDKQWHKPTVPSRVTEWQTWQNDWQRLT